MRGTYEDLEWFAIDSVGHIALFTTGNSPYIPSCFVSRPGLLEKVANIVSRLTQDKGHRIVTGQLDNWMTACWTMASDRGLFAYDYNEDDLPIYQLFSVPMLAYQPSVDNIEWTGLIPKYSGVFSEKSRVINAAAVFEWKPQLE